MLLNLTEEQVTQLAPDAPSVKAGKGLAKESKWVLLEYSERAIWGHCQGSGKNPYQTVIDVKNIAFKCSCPSRKFPCKHSLGLLYLYVANSDIFKSAEDADWVATWLSKREERAEKKEQKAKSDKPVDEVAQAKRQAMRHKKVLNGIDELQIWIKDLLHNGLLNVPERIYTLFDNITRRMVDAQATGLANRLANIQEINFYDETWKHKLTDQLGKLYLLSESYKNLEKQSEEWQHEIRTQIGYPQAKEEVLSGEAISDQWLVLHKKTSKLNNLTTETYWLYGQNTKRWAVYLNFIVPGSLPELSLISGNVYKGELCFYKGVRALRALFKSNELSKETFIPTFCKDLEEGFAEYRKALQENPFLENVPILVENVRVANQGKIFYVQDVNNKLITIQLKEEDYIYLLSITGGKPFSAFFLADDLCWELNSIWYQSNYYFWKNESN